MPAYLQLLIDHQKLLGDFDPIKVSGLDPQWFWDRRVALIDFRGATQLTFLVYHQKIGTGTISYQLWNETDGAEICVLNDTQAAGVRYLETTVAVAINATKRVRVRAKSTVAADDPIFFGSSVLLNN